MERALYSATSMIDAEGWRKNGFSVAGNRFQFVRIPAQSVIQVEGDPLMLVIYFSLPTVIAFTIFGALSISHFYSIVNLMRT